MKQLRDVLSEFANQVEWSVKVPGAAEIDRKKEETAQTEAHQQIIQDLLDMVGEDEELHSPVDKRSHLYFENLDMETRNQLRQELRQKLKEYGSIK